MNIAVLSDIHGNYIALQKCLDYALNLGIQTFIFLGDYHGELAYPQKTMEILYTLQEKYTCYFIRGNKEDYWFSYKKNGETGWRYHDSTTGSLLYIYERLTADDLNFFAGMPHTQTIAFEGLPALTVCHGSPRKSNEKLLPDNETTFTIMDADENSLILCGHTHVQTEIKYGSKTVLNPGAVGVPIGSDGKTQFLILHGANETWQHEFISLEYDVEKVISDLHEAGLNEFAPYWCKITENLLRTGEVSHGVVLARAMQLCSQKTGQCKWPNIPEECWEQAVREMVQR